LLLDLILDRDGLRERRRRERALTLFSQRAGSLGLGLQRFHEKGDEFIRLCREEGRELGEQGRLVCLLVPERFHAGLQRWKQKELAGRTVRSSRRASLKLVSCAKRSRICCRSIDRR